MSQVPVCHKCGRVRCVCPARRARAALVALATAALLLALAACGPAYEQGPAGRVVDKDKDYKASTKTTKYELTVVTPDGEEHEFRVTRGDYNDCFKGSAYPRCTDR